MESQNNYQQSLEIPKAIVYTAQFLQFLSPQLASMFARRLFRTPFKHKMPKREFHMDRNSRQYLLLVPSVAKKVMVYEYGDSAKKILLAHGWSGRGTQLVKIADALLARGYSTVSFDAPAHGKTKDKVTDMREFVNTILYLDMRYGPFHGAVGHSLGGMSLLNAVRRGLKLQRLATVGSGDVVTDIMEDFVLQLGLKREISIRMQTYFEKKFGEPMNDYSASFAASEVDIPVLVVHDTEDKDVPVGSGRSIHKNLNNSELLITSGLGHRRILGNPEVISKITTFLTEDVG